MSGPSDRYGIGDVVALTGVAEATLRMWERRHGFPVPHRLPSGHRRYSERDVELIRQVVAERASGRSLAAAIERVSEHEEPVIPSLFATLRSRHPDLAARTLPKRMVTALTHALEDETLARAERSVVFGAFQREHFYRQAEPRWGELTRRADVAIAFADFPAVRAGGAAPAEVPVGVDHPMSREWALVCDADGFAACLTAWEPPASSTRREEERFFETLWSVEPEVVRDAVGICASVAAWALPELAERARARTADRPALPPARQLGLATSVTARTLAYLGAPV